MSSQSRRCPTCYNIMPLARRKCPSCQRELPLADDTRTLEVLFLQEELTGKFEILSELNRCGNSTLFLTQDLVLDRHVALKTIKFDKDVSQEHVNRWNQNLKRCIRLDEPHLARLYSFGAVKSLQYVILEYISDKTLEDVLDEEPDGLPVWKCLRLGRDIASGLHSAHNLGICHHRLTPANISVSNDGFCRILDLGAAEGTIEALAQRPWTPETDSSLYFSPEQIETGFSEPPSDQYRLGLIMFQALTGKLPFENSGEEGAFERLHTIPLSASHVNSAIPEELSRIIAKTLARQPEDRYEDCLALANDLEGLEPDLWLPDIETVYKGATQETTIALVLSEIQQQVKNKDYSRALILCEQALAMAPYNNEVISSMLRIQKLHEKELKLRSIINKALIAFYANSLNDALAILKNGRQIDKDNPEILRLTHEVMHEQERQRLITVLLDAARIDLAKQAYSSAMSNVVRVLDMDSKNETALKLKQRIEFGMKDHASLGILLNKAETEYKNNNYTKAEALVKKVLKSDSGNLTAKKLNIRILQQKKYSQLMELWENLHDEMQNGRYRNAMSLLRQIAQLEPSLKQDIRNRLIAIREKIAKNDIQKDKKESAQPSENNDPEIKFDGLPESSAMETTNDELINETVDLGVPDHLKEPESSNDITPVKSISNHLRRVFNKNNRKSGIIYTALLIIVILSIPLMITRIRSSVSESKTDIVAVLETPTVVPTESLSIPDHDIVSQNQADINAVASHTQIDTDGSYEETKPEINEISDTIHSMIVSGIANEQRGNFVLAAALYREVLKTHPGNEDAQKGLKRCNTVLNSRTPDNRHPGIN